MLRTVSTASLRRAGLALAGLLALAPVFTPLAAAEDTATTPGALTISHPWARASAGRAAAGAAFMTITNSGPDDSLVAAGADVSEVVELHTHIKDGEVMRMRRVESIAIPGGTDTVLQPGGLHVMFIGLHAPLEEGQTFPVSLTFEQAGTLDVSVTVKGVGAMGMDHGRDSTAPAR